MEKSAQIQLKFLHNELRCNLCDFSLIYQREIATTKRDIRRLLFALLLHSTVEEVKLFR